MDRKLAFLVLLLFAAACGSQVAETLPEQPLPPSSPTPSNHPLVARISEILQSGWEVKQDGNVIVASRHAPVSMYGNIAMPAMLVGFKKALMERSFTLNYKISIEIGNLVSKAERVRKLETNRETELELERLADLMGGFQAKGDFFPRNEQEKKLYEEYRTALRTLPYERIPDLYDDQHSYYVSTPRHRNASFTFPRDERECRAVLENIFSFLDGYGDLNAQTKEDEKFDYPFDQLAKIVFYSDREADRHQRLKENHLPELRRSP